MPDGWIIEERNSGVEIKGQYQYLSGVFWKHSSVSCSPALHSL